MSSSKSGKRISVFDRLGPGNDEAPPSHRRYSGEKHATSGEKSRHAYGPLPPPGHIREDLPPGMRERKPSHEYEDKHMHYRDGAPPTLPRPRHRAPPPSEYPGELEEDGTRRGSVPSSQAPPVSSRKPTRDLPEGHKTDRVGSGKGSRSSSRPSSVSQKPLSSVDPGVGGSGSDMESGGEEERKRRRTHQDSQRRAKHESVGDDGGAGRRMSKHLDRKEKLHSSSSVVPGSVESSPALGVPASVVGGPPPTPTSGDSKKRARKEAALYKRHSKGEDEYSESTRSLERKRKRDQNDDELLTLETKKLRTSAELHDYHTSSKDIERSSSRSQGGELIEMEGRGSGERKRRHESLGLKDEGPSRKSQRMCSPDVSGTVGVGGSSSRRQTSNHSSRVAMSPSMKRNESHRKDRKVPSTGSNDSITEDSPLPVNERDGESSKSSHRKLDWLLVNSYTRRATAKLEQRPKSALKKYTPGAIFTDIGVSPSLAGSEYYSKITSVVSAHLKELQQEGACPTEPSLVTPLPESIVNDPFGNAEFASAGVSRISEQLEWNQLIPNSIGMCRRALTASADFNLRRKLRKTTNQRPFLPASHTPTSTAVNWDSEHYATAVALYHSMGKKASGKPAFRLQQSKVGTLLVAR